MPVVARIRSVKPEFFQHEAIFEAEKQSGLPLRLAYIGLWTRTDRRGVFRWKPRELMLNILPWDGVDFGAVLDALERHGFLFSYEVAGERYGYIPGFAKHQVFNLKERGEANIPNPPDTVLTRCRHGASTESTAPGTDGLEWSGEGKGMVRGREGEGTGGGEPKPGRGAASAPGGGPPAGGGVRKLPAGMNEDEYHAALESRRAALRALGGGA